MWKHSLDVNGAPVLDLLCWRDEKNNTEKTNTKDERIQRKINDTLGTISHRISSNWHIIAKKMLSVNTKILDPNSILLALNKTIKKKITITKSLNEKKKENGAEYRSKWIKIDGKKVETWLQLQQQLKTIEQRIRSDRIKESWR